MAFIGCTELTCQLQDQILIDSNIWENEVDLESNLNTNISDNDLKIRFEEEVKSFKKSGGKITNIYSLVYDYDAEAGTIDGHYFNQDILVASLILKNSPIKHIDVGSRIDGFVSHVAVFRQITVMDIRDLNNINHPYINFIKQDLMSDSIPEGITDSISSLHAIEHFGLGRYGDTIDPMGHIKGFNNILKMLEVDGMLYISFPIAKKNHLHFNAHRVFHPLNILNWPYDSGSINIERFDYISDSGQVYYDVDLFENYKNLNISVYGCGIYSVRKLR